LSRRRSYQERREPFWEPEGSHEEFSRSRVLADAITLVADALVVGMFFSTEGRS
jgi:hypothetical protein